MIVDVAVAEMEPLLRRAVALDPACLVRLKSRDGRMQALVWLPFQVLVGRAVGDAELSARDETYRCADLLAGNLIRRDTDWHWSSPPDRGWQRVERIEAEVVRRLVASGARAVQDAAAREGLPAHAQPRAEVTDALLESTVLVAERDALRAEVNLRLVSALNRMGFVPQNTHVAIDVQGRWVRLAAPYGSAYWRDPSGISLT